MARPYQLWVCKKAKWSNRHNVRNFDPPQFGELVTVSESLMHKGEELVSFKEKGENVFWPLKHFEQYQPNHDFAEYVLKDITENRNIIR